jgi:hypothetical protein
MIRRNAEYEILKAWLAGISPLESRFAYSMIILGFSDRAAPKFPSSVCIGRELQWFKGKEIFDTGTPDERAALRKL